MKKLYIIFPVLLLLGMSACLHDEKDIFDSSAAARIDAAVKEYATILASAENGWVMEYYPSPTQSYGGYNILVSFTEEGYTNVASEKTGANKVSTSLFSLIADNGPVLSFNTYNEIMHFFSNPKNPDNIGADGVGMEGDYEFIIMECTPELVVLKGKKTENIITMRPMQSDMSWSTYLLNLQNANEDMIFYGFDYSVNDKKYAVRKTNYRTLKVTHVDSEGDPLTEEVAFILTLDGYRLYNPLIVDGVEVSAFEYVPNGNDSYFKTEANTVLEPINLPLNEIFLVGNWHFKGDAMSTTALGNWNVLRNNLEPEGWDVYTAYIGTYGDLYGFSLTVAELDASFTYPGAILYNYKLIDDDKIAFDWGGNSSGYAYDFYIEYGGTSIINAFLSNNFQLNNDYFKLTTDNINNPSWIKMVRSLNQNFEVTLYKDVYIFPFRD